MTSSIPKRAKPVFEPVPDQATDASPAPAAEAGQGGGNVSPLSAVPAAAAPAQPAPQVGELAYLAKLAQSMAPKKEGKKQTQRMTLDLSEDLHDRIKTVAFMNKSTMVVDVELHLRRAYFPEEFEGKA